MRAPVIGRVGDRIIYQIMGAADDVEVSAGSGTKVATDERVIGASTAHVQRVAPHGTPNLTVGQVAVSTAATAICDADSTRHSITVVNRQLASVYVDDSTAVSTAAFRLDPGDSVTWATGAAIYGITAAAYTATGDAKVHFAALHD